MSNLTEDYVQVENDLARFRSLSSYDQERELRRLLTRDALVDRLLVEFGHDLDLVCWALSHECEDSDPPFTTREADYIETLLIDLRKEGRCPC